MSGSEAGVAGGVLPGDWYALGGKGAGAKSRVFVEVEVVAEVVGE